jgi:DNA-nicking Smr family endonuclease
MKKKKRNEDQPADFRNLPFKSLKGFSPSAPHAKRTEPIRPKKEKASEEPEDDRALFLQAVSGVRTMGKKHAQAEPSPPHPSPVREDDRALFLDAMKKIGSALRTEVHEEEGEEGGHERRSPSSRMRQMKRGTIRVSRELDLHGYVRDEALAHLERFISTAHQQGDDAVLVITGKGVNSPDGPVLQGAVVSWLRGRGKRMIAEFSPAPRDKGGTGAFVVFLRKA